MPLEQSSSKGAFSRNVSTLMGEVGKSPHVKDRKQALAIAYSTQRRNRAGGGNVSAFQDEMGAMGGLGGLSGLGGMGGMGGLFKGLESRLPPQFMSGMGSYLKGIESKIPPQLMNAFEKIGDAYKERFAPAAGLFGGSMNNTQENNPFSGLMSGFNQQNQTSPQWQTHNNYQPVMQPPIGGSMGIAPSNPAAPSINQNQGTSGGSDLVTAMQGIARKAHAGGGIEDRAYGGFNMLKAPSLNPSYQNKMEMRGVMHTGPILSNVPGRTDHHSAHVPSSSYVLPADIIAGRGQGNTLAGMQSYMKLFRMGPYGTSLPHLGHGRGIPRGPKLQQVAHAGGGKGTRSNIGSPVPVNLAGGELVIPPENLMDVVHPDIDTAHKIMDQFVLSERKQQIKELQKLPPPAKD